MFSASVFTICTRHLCFLFNSCIGATVEVLSGEDKMFKGLFFQDAMMKDAIRAYPEIIFLDATYKLLELALPIYLFICRDSNGQSEVVGVGILVAEDVDSLKWLEVA